MTDAEVSSLTGLSLDEAESLWALYLRHIGMRMFANLMEPQNFH